ncbi:unnamed protein product, partial [Allacma fusca]
SNIIKNGKRTPFWDIGTLKSMAATELGRCSSLLFHHFLSTSRRQPFLSDAPVAKCEWNYYFNKLEVQRVT